MFAKDKDQPAIDRRVGMYDRKIFSLMEGSIIEDHSLPLSRERRRGVSDAMQWMESPSLMHLRMGRHVAWKYAL